MSQPSRGASYADVCAARGQSWTALTSAAMRYVRGGATTDRVWAMVVAAPVPLARGERAVDRAPLVQVLRYVRRGVMTLIGHSVRRRTSEHMVQVALFAHGEGIEDIAGLLQTPCEFAIIGDELGRMHVIDATMDVPAGPYRPERVAEVFTEFYKHELRFLGLDGRPHSFADVTVHDAWERRARGRWLPPLRDAAGLLTRTESAIIV